VSTKDWLEKDFYATLGVSKDASAEDIKKSYRKLARAHHPDNHPGDAKAEQKFKEISEAYSVLSSRDKRKEYDEARSLFGSFSRGGPFRRRLPERVRRAAEPGRPAGDPALAGGGLRPGAGRLLG